MDYKSFQTKVITVDIEEEMKKSFLDYSMSVIVSRALPDVRDGLKPVHRRILYTMYEAGLLPEKKYLKCAATVGDVLGKYHPHGDASVYDALVRLAQSFSMRYPLVDGHGNFGSMDGDPPAAYRYTEAKMAKLAMPLLTDIEKETVPFVTNYDDRLKEPAVLPSKFPNLLVNGSLGIAVGMATNIPPHNLSEVIDGAVFYIEKKLENPDFVPSFDQLMQYIKAPDFPTSGIIMGKSGIRNAYATGKGRIILRAETHFETIAGKTCIIADSVPYMVNKAKLVERIAELSKEKRVQGIHHVNDESNKDGLRIVIELKKDANPDLVLNRLFSFSDLQTSVSMNFLAIVDGVPKTLTLVEYLRQYLKFQFEVITKRTNFELRKAREREHILEGLAIAVDNVDEVVNILKNSASIPDGKINLENRFGIDAIQSEAIVQMTIGRITGLEKQKILDELAALKLKIADLLNILANESRVYTIIKEEMLEIKRKFGDPRKTSIEEVDGEIDDEDIIPVTNCVLTYTNIGYIKRVDVETYKAQKRGGRGISGVKQRDEEFPSQILVSSSHDYLLFFSNLGRVYRMKCYQIPEASRNSKGTNIVNLLPLKENETITEIIKVSDFENGGFIVTVTKNGLVKRTRLSEFKNVLKVGKNAITLDDDDEIAGIKLTEGNNELLIATRNGRAMRLNEEKIRPTGRTAHGVIGIRLIGGDDYVVSLARVREGAAVLTITDNGFGKRSLVESYRLTARGSQGVLNTISDPERLEKLGKTSGIKVVDENDDVLIVADNGVVIRVKASDIRLCSRTSGGVRVIRMPEGSSVAAFTRTEHDEDEEFDTIDGEIVEGTDESDESDESGEDAIEN